MRAVSLGDPQSMNLYAYCGNDPINHVDPDGLFFKKLWRGLKKLGKAILKVLSNKWVQLAITVALVVLATPAAGFFGFAESAGRWGAKQIVQTILSGVLAVGAIGRKLQDPKRDDEIDDEEIEFTIVTICPPDGSGDIKLCPGGTIIFKPPPPAPEPEVMEMGFLPIGAIGRFLARLFRRARASGARNARALPSLSRTTIDNVIESSRAAKGATTRGASLLEKRVADGTITGIKPTQANAEQILKDVLNNPLSVQPTGRFGQLDVVGRSLGQNIGVRINTQTNNLIGFRRP